MTSNKQEKKKNRFLQWIFDNVAGNIVYSIVVFVVVAIGGVLFNAFKENVPYNKQTVNTIFYIIFFILIILIELLIAFLAKKYIVNPNLDLIRQKLKKMPTFLKENIGDISSFFIAIICVLLTYPLALNIAGFLTDRVISPWLHKQYHGESINNDYYSDDNHYYVRIKMAENSEVTLSGCDVLGGAQVDYFKDESGNLFARFNVPNEQTLANMMTNCSYSLDASKYYTNINSYWKFQQYQCGEKEITSTDELKNTKFTEDTTCEVSFIPDRYGQGDTLEEIMVPDGIDDREYPIVAFYDYDGTLLKITTVEKGKDVEEPEVPTREGYFFKSWSKDLKNVQESMDVVATYQDPNDEYSVLYLLDDPTLAKIQNPFVILEYGKTIAEQDALPIIEYTPEQIAEGWTITKVTSPYSNQPDQDLKDFYGYIVVEGNYTFVIHIGKPKEDS